MATNLPRKNRERKNRERKNRERKTGKEKKQAENSYAASSLRVRLICLVRFPGPGCGLHCALRHVRDVCVRRLGEILYRVPRLCSGSSCRGKARLATSEWARQAVRSFTSSLSKRVLCETADCIPKALLHRVDISLVGVGDLGDLA